MKASLMTALFLTGTSGQGAPVIAATCALAAASAFVPSHAVSQERLKVIKMAKRSAAAAWNQVAMVERNLKTPHEIGG
jgi:hypothetical protein